MHKIIGTLRVPTNHGAPGFVRLRYEAYCGTCDPGALTPSVHKTEEERAAWTLNHIAAWTNHNKIYSATIVEVCVDES